MFLPRITEQELDQEWLWNLKTLDGDLYSIQKFSMESFKWEFFTTNIRSCIFNFEEAVEEATRNSQYQPTRVCRVGRYLADGNLVIMTILKVIVPPQQ